MEKPRTTPEQRKDNIIIIEPTSPKMLELYKEACANGAALPPLDDLAPTQGLVFDSVPLGAWSADASQKIITVFYKEEFTSDGYRTGRVFVDRIQARYFGDIKIAAPQEGYYYDKNLKYTINPENFAYRVARTEWVTDSDDQPDLARKVGVQAVGAVLAVA